MTNCHILPPLHSYHCSVVFFSLLSPPHFALPLLYVSPSFLPFHSYIMCIGRGLW